MFEEVDNVQPLFEEVDNVQPLFEEVDNVQQTAALSTCQPPPFLQSYKNLPPELQEDENLEADTDSCVSDKKKVPLLIFIQVKLTLRYRGHDLMQLEDQPKFSPDSCHAKEINFESQADVMLKRLLWDGRVIFSWHLEPGLQRAAPSPCNYDDNILVKSFFLISPEVNIS